MLGYCYFFNWKNTNRTVTNNSEHAWMNIKVIISVGTSVHNAYLNLKPPNLRQLKHWKVKQWGDGNDTALRQWEEDRFVFCFFPTLTESFRGFCVLEQRHEKKKSKVAEKSAGLRFNPRSRLVNSSILRWVQQQLAETWHPAKCKAELIRTGPTSHTHTHTHTHTNLSVFSH